MQSRLIAQEVIDGGIDRAFELLNRALEFDVLASLGESRAYLAGGKTVVAPLSPSANAG